MNSTRSTMTYYVAAFLFGVAIALLVATPGRSAEPAAPNSTHSSGALQ